MNKSKLKSASSPVTVTADADKADQVVLVDQVVQADACPVVAPEAADSPPADEPGQEKYELLDELGSGGMGAVYRARRQGVDKTLAVKKLHARFVSDAGSVKRFEQEAKSASLLTHHNLVSLYDFGLSRDGTPYLVMDYIDGISLAALVHEHKQLPPARVVNIFQQACEGLVHAHAKKVIHRDLKPNNIMLTKTDEELDLVKIVDFGIAKLMPQAETREQRLTQTGDVLGSPVYMSPEQCAGRFVDERSDIYSLGCVMYECLMGQPPFLGENIVLTILQHLNDKPAPFATCRPDLDIPEPLERIVMKCLEKTPSQRYQSAAELRDELELVSSDTTPSRRKFIRARVGRAKLAAFLKRRGRLLVTVSSVALLIGMSTAFFLRQNTDEKLLQKLVNAAEVSDMTYKNQLAIPAWEAALKEAIRLHKPAKQIAVMHMRLATALQTAYRHAESVEHARAADKLLTALDDATPQRLQSLALLRRVLLGSPDEELRPDHFKAVELNNQAAGLMHQLKLDEATIKLKQALKLAPYYEHAQRNLNTIVASQGSEGANKAKITDREMTFTKSRSDTNASDLRDELLRQHIDADSAAVRWQMSLQALRNLDYVGAIAEGEAAQQMDPKIADNNLLRLMASLRSDGPVMYNEHSPLLDEATAATRKELALRKAIFNAEHYELRSVDLLLSELLIAGKHFSEAESVIEDALKSKRFDASTDGLLLHSRLLVATAEQHKWQEAQVQYDKVFANLENYNAITPNYMPFVRTYLETLRASGRTADFQRNLDRLIAFAKSKGIMVQGDSFSSGGVQASSDLSLP